MTAEESACKGAGEVQKAELERVDPEKGIAAEEKDGEGVGGPFVIVNGDSDDLSEKSSDLDPAVAEEKEVRQQPNVVSEEVGDEQVGAVDGTDEAVEANGHDHAEESADPVAAESSEVGVDESKDEQVAELERIGTIDGEESEGVVNAASGSDEQGEDEVQVCMAHGHDHAEESARPVVEPESTIQEREDGVLPVVAELEERIEEDSEEIVQDGALAAADSAAEPEPPVEERKDEVVPAVAELEKPTETTSEEIVQDDELAKDEGDPSSLQPVEPELDPSAELGEDHKVEIKLSAQAESTPEESAAKADIEVELESADIGETQELGTVVEDGNQPLHLNSVGDVEEKEVREPVPLEEISSASVQQHTANPSLEVEEHEQLESSGDHLADKDDSDILDSGRESQVEPKQESESKVVDDAELQAASELAVSTMQNEPRSLEDEHCLMAPEFEAREHTEVEEDHDSSDKSITIVAEAETSAAKEDESVVVDEPKPKDVVDEAEGSAAKEDEFVVVDEAEPSAANEDECVVVDESEPSPAKEADESVVVDEAEPKHVQDLHSENAIDSGSSENVVDAASSEAQVEVSNISTPPDDVSLETGNTVSSPIHEPVSSQIDEACHSDGALEAPHPVDETCPSEGPYEEICSENINAFTKSSLEVEMIEGDEHKDDDEQVQQDEAKIDKGDVQVIRPQKVFIIKVPRFASEEIWKKIQDAQSHLDQLTQNRDSINVIKQKQKVGCDEYREKLEAARAEERAARAAHGDKKHDLSSVQSMIGKLNKANSIEEIDEMIAMKNKIIQHETIALKEEKLLIQEIKELKAQRKQLYSNMGSKAEIDEAFHQKEHIHERHKTLKKDSDVLLNNLKSLEEKTKVVQKIYDDERAALRKLNEEYRAANEIRQKAYDDWFELKMEPGKKNKFFFMYKKDRNTASEYLSLGDMEGLQLYCNNQVERFLEIWNKNEDFRRQYVEANKISTLKRLGTPDGRRLGPNEDPPVIPSNFNRRTSNPSPLPVSSPHVPIVASEARPEKSIPAAAPVKEDSFPVLQGPQTSKRAKSKESGSSSQKEMATAPLSEREDEEHIEEEKTRRMEEELELARKAEELARRDEELRKENAAAEKERLRLEQKAKAKEAEERKKRKAEKAQERADYKARKEAENKEKKKAKKDKKKGTTVADSASGSGESSTAAIAATDTESCAAENTREADVPVQTTSKRPSRPAVAVKQLNRVQPVPLPLRNRSKRKMRSWILMALAVLSVLALFVAGNYISFSSFSPLQF